MLDLGTFVMIGVVGALPLILLGYVRSRVRHALKTLGKPHQPPN
jgi:hypothetical protein